uniref:Uncharacterized protein n=1 Tax=Rhinolophus ferrumequinum TaxID=59479 RepID=A0A671DMX0_RHIFE
VFPSLYRRQSVLSVLARISSFYRGFGSNLFGSPRLWHNHDRSYSALSGRKAEALRRLGVWGWSGTGSAWAAWLALLEAFRKHGSGGGSWILSTLLTAPRCPVRGKGRLADIPVALVMPISDGTSTCIKH